VLNKYVNDIEISSFVYSWICKLLYFCCKIPNSYLSFLF